MSVYCLPILRRVRGFDRLASRFRGRRLRTGRACLATCNCRGSVSCSSLGATGCGPAGLTSAFLHRPGFGFLAVGFRGFDRLAARVRCELGPGLRAAAYLRSVRSASFVRPWIGPVRYPSSSFPPCAPPDRLAGDRSARYPLSSSPLRASPDRLAGDRPDSLPFIVLPTLCAPNRLAAARFTCIAPPLLSADLRAQL